MRIGLPRETTEGERRVALVPDTVRKLTAEGHEVVVEFGAGAGALLADALYEQAGARLVGDPAAVYGCDVAVKVAPPTPEEIGHLRPAGVLIGFLAPLANAEGV